MANTFIIQGRIVHKNSMEMKIIRKKSKSFFWILMTDAQNHVMKINFWREAARKWEPILVKGQVYSATGLRIFEANSEYASYGNVELNVQPHSEFNLVPKPNELIFPQAWKFISNIESIQQKPTDSLVDVIAIACDIQETQVISTRKGDTVQVRFFQIMDESQKKIEVSVWRKDAEIIIKEQQIIGLSACRVRGYGGLSLSVQGFLEPKPEDPRVKELTLWKQQNKTILRTIINQIKSITDESLTTNDRDFYAANIKKVSALKTMQKVYYFTHSLPDETVFKVNAQITRIENKLFYSKNGNKHWCLKMEIKNIKINNEPESDATVKVTAFSPIADKIMNETSANEAAQMQKENFEDFLSMVNAVQKSEQKYCFGIFIKESDYYEQSKMDFIIETIEKI